METQIKQYPQIIDLHDVKEITTLSRSSIYQLIKDGEFPKQRKLIGSRTVWQTQEVLDWLNTKMEAAQ